MLLISLKLVGDTLHVKTASFMSGNTYRSFIECINAIPGMVHLEEEYTWIVPKEALDKFLDIFGEDGIAWFNSIEEIRGTEQPVLPTMTVTDEGLEDMKLSPYPFQTAGICFLHDNKRGILGDEMGLGKAQPLDAKILTPDGWKLMGDINIGDFVIDSNGKATKVLNVYPQGEKDIYKILFSDGSSTESCDEHLWAVNTPTRRFTNSAYLVKELNEFKDELKYKNGNSKYFIPMTKPIEFKNRELPIAPYLLGYILGNGGLTGKSTPIISIPDIETVKTLEKLLPDESAFSSNEGIDYRIVGSDGKRRRNIFKSFLVDLDLWGKYSFQKHIPHDYKFSCIDDRIQLLQGLLDSDGHVRPKDNNVEFSTSSSQLAKDIQFIIHSLGGTASIRTKETTHLIVYRMSVALPQSIKPFKLSRKSDIYHSRKKYPPRRAFSSVEWIGKKESQCIRVESDDQLYITDDCIVTHNTPQAIGAFHRLKKSGKVNKALVICPTSLKHQWAEEIEKFTHYTSTVLDGTPKKRVKQFQSFLDEDNNFLIINYEMLRNKDDLARIQSIQADVIICDEIHKIKNRNSQASKAVKKLNAEYKFGLTGTPMQNRLDELWNIMDWLDPSVLGQYGAFRKRHIATGEKFGKFNVEIGYKRLGEVRRKVGPVILRRMKEDVAPELPELLFNTYRVEMTPVQRKIQESVMNEMELLRAEIEDFEAKHPGEYNDAGEWEQPKHPKDAQILGLLNILIANSDSPELLRMSESGMVKRFVGQFKDDAFKSPKLDELKSICTDALEQGNQKVVIFTQFSRMQELAREVLSKVGGVEILNGSMTGEQRQAAVKNFRDNPDINFFLLTDAGNFGLKLAPSSLIAGTS